MYRRGAGGGFPGMAPRVAGFPGPVVVAASVPEGLIALPGFQEADGRPWSVQVRYRDPGDARRRVVVRTTRGALDWTPVIGTVENVYTVMANCEARPLMPILEQEALVEIDGGGAVPGVRIECHDGDCAVAFDWRGQHAYVVGVRELVDGLRLRGGAVADFEAYDAAHLGRYGPGAQ